MPQVITNEHYTSIEAIGYFQGASLKKSLSDIETLIRKMDMSDVQSFCDS